MTSDRIVPADLTQQPDDLCTCGHRRDGHIYNEGACRIGGVICPCPSFDLPVSKKFTKLNAPKMAKPPQFSPEQMEALLDAKSPGWRDDLPKLERLPDGDPYWKVRAFELGQEVLDLRLDNDRLRTKVIGCDCGIIHDAYNDQRLAIEELQRELRS